MTILTGAGVEKLTPFAKGVSAGIKTSDGKSASHDFSHAIVAVGILPNTENIGLEQLGVKSTKGHIDTDPYRSEEHTSELQSLMSISYAFFCLKKKKTCT